MCEGSLGYPPGHIEIQADFSGEFTTILTLENNKTDVAFIHVEETEVNDTTCSAHQTLKFAIENVPLEFHRKRLRCVTVPSTEVSDQTAVISEEGSIKVVRSMYLFFSYI